VQTYSSLVRQRCRN